jgi:hypothetical protein
VNLTFIPIIEFALEKILFMECISDVVFSSLLLVFPALALGAKS